MNQANKKTSAVAADFLRLYNARDKDALWQKHSQTFRSFWKKRILSASDDQLSDAECDSIIRILDSKGKGNTRESESVAHVSMPQGAWRKLFNELHSNRKLGQLVFSILEETSEKKKSKLIDQLYEENKTSNRLTGPTGNVINAFLAAYDPVNNLSMVSLNHRKVLCQFLDITALFDWQTMSNGERIVQSNRILVDTLRNFGLGQSASARTVATFCYWENMRLLWDKASKPNKSEIDSPWWHRFFTSEKQAHQVFDLFKDCCLSLGVIKSRGKTTERISFTNVVSKNKEWLRLNCANILTFQIGALENGKSSTLIVMRDEEKQGSYIPEGYFANAFNGHKTGFCQVDLGDLLDPNSIAKKLLLTSLGDIAAAHSGIKKRTFPLAHRPRLLNAVFDKKLRAEFFKNGPRKPPEIQESEVKPKTNHSEFMHSPSKNRILYGPPGTGKTYSSIDRALEILDPDLVASTMTDKNFRAKRKARFDELFQAKRIGFVTFHQSFSYEDFVEGLKASTDEEGQIKYEVEDGIFKQMCSAAAASSGVGGSGSVETIDLKGRTIWKMSLGNTLGPDAAIYDECIENGYVLLGWGQDIDFTGATSRDDIKAKVKARNSDGVDSDYTVTACHAFVNTMKHGDLIIVSDGNHKFRAIGVVKGDYRFLPVAEDREQLFQQCRDVDWVRTYSPSLPSDQLMTVAFSQMSLYRLKPPAIDLEMVQSLLSENETSETGSPRPFVLIIDEINRGNISRIFGELITLIEESKRAGNQEALAVKLPYSKEMFSVPANLYLIGTMNTADRSLAQLDIALRRRFVFEQLMPDPSKLQGLTIDGIDISRILTAMNERIEILYDREHTIGHAFFLPLREKPTMTELQRIFTGSILPLLEEYFYEDWEKIRLVLADNRKPANLAMIVPKYTEAQLESLFGMGSPHTINPAYQRNTAALEMPEAYIAIYDATQKVAQLNSTSLP